VRRLWCEFYFRPCGRHPAQAATRAALEQKLNDLNNPQSSRHRQRTHLPERWWYKPGKSATNVTESAPAKNGDAANCSGGNNSDGGSRGRSCG